MKRIHKKVIKDLKLRRTFVKKEFKSKFFKMLLHNRFLCRNIRRRIFIKSQRIKISIVKICNRCVFTGRSKGIIRLFKISRIVFKNLVTRGLLIGVKKIN